MHKKSFLAGGFMKKRGGSPKRHDGQKWVLEISTKKGRWDGHILGRKEETKRRARISGTCPGLPDHSAPEQILKRIK